MNNSVTQMIKQILASLSFYLSTNEPHFGEIFFGSIYLATIKIDNENKYIYNHHYVQYNYRNINNIH